MQDRLWPVWALLLGAVGLSLAEILPDFQLDLLAGWTTFGILALSLDLVWGYAGIFSFGQTAFFGVAAYFFGTLTVNLDPNTANTVAWIPVAALIGGALFSAVLGYFLFFSRIGDVQVAITTYAATLVLLVISTGYQHTFGSAVVGGENGMTGIPGLAIGGRVLGAQGSYVLVVCLSVALYVLLRFLSQSWFGRIVRAMRVNQLRTELLGYDVRTYRLVAFTIGGAIAGLAGALYAAEHNFISPNIFNLTNAALVVIWVLVGGRGTLVGAFVGAILVNWLSYVLGGRIGAGQSTLILGFLLILAVLVLPGGVIGAIKARVFKRVARRRTAILPTARAEAASNRAAIPTAPQRGKVVLSANDIIKDFGGVRAVAGVTLEFQANQLHSLIGPNGAGKTTLFNILVGRYRPNHGRVIFGGLDITKWQPHRRAKAGIGIKTQTSDIYGELTVHENVWLAAFSRVRRDRGANAQVADVLAEIGLAERADEIGDYLSHGEQQWLEIGMLLALQPTVVLLDEPAAGMTAEESARSVSLIRDLARQATVIVVEHDMNFIRMLGAPTTVIHQGAVFAQGSINELRRDERVLDIYLGRANGAATR